MAKLKNYNGSVQLIAGITQKGGGDFALVEANAIQTREDGTRLDAELETIRAQLPNAEGTVLLQSDWEQSDSTQIDYIKNKPSIYTKAEIDAMFEALGDIGTVEYWDGSLTITGGE